MADKPKQRPQKIVDYGNGPHIYANDITGIMFDGAAVTLTLGNAEARISHKNQTPTEAPVISICGKITLSPKAAIDAINMLNNMLTVLQNQHEKAPNPSAVN